MAAASDVTQYTNDDWKALYGIPEPCYEDFEDSEEYAAVWDAWYEGYSAFIFSTIQVQEEADRLAAEETAHQEGAAPAPAEAPPEKPIESAGIKNGNNNPPVDNNAPDKYPLGSYVDLSGTVWSPDGTRLSPDPAAGAALDPAADPGYVLPSEAASDPVWLSASADPDTLAVIADTVSEIAADPPVWYVEDLRPSDPPVEVLEGMKSLVASIFGEYTPVTTTSVVTQTVGNDTYQYLVETVAPGAAGVDYEWVSSVFLFGILLYCLMKLLGGVLK